MLGALTPKSFRGDVVAAGVIVLLIAAGLFELRAIDALSPWLRAGLLGSIWLWVGTLAWRAAPISGRPLPYQQVLYVTTLLFGLLLYGALGQALTGGRWLAGFDTITIVLALSAMHAAAFARLRSSAVCTLLAAVLCGAALVAAFVWGGGADGGGSSPVILWGGSSPQTGPLAPGGVRWLLLALVVIYGLGAVQMRDRSRRHGVALTQAAGSALVGIAMTWDLALLPWPSAELVTASPGWGWTLLLLSGGFGLVAYGGVDGERGPVWIGVLVLYHFAVLERDGGLLGWPVVLAAAAALLLVAGLRPSRPLPPPPDADLPVAETVPFPLIRRLRERSGQEQSGDDG